MSNFAWVTLTTNDTYSLGALVLAHSLRRAGTQHQLAVLVTPGVSESMRDKLKDVYNVVQEVNIMDSQDSVNLALLARPELGITFTKLHCWRLVQFEKCVFLDSDTLVLQNCDELFEREEFSAAPDVSWPDCFNSGVFVYKPSQETFDKIVEFGLKNGSFDGGDQGLLNQYFADWATSDIKKRLPFLYNVTAYASYCYLPAFKQFRDKIKILHFAGKMKPWLIHYNSQSKTPSVPSDYAHAADLIQLWWNIFFDNVHQKLNDNMRYFMPDLMGWKSNYDNMIYQQQQHYYEQQPQQQQQEEYNKQYQHYQENYTQEKVEFHDPWVDFYKKEETKEQEQMQTNNDNEYQEYQDYQYEEYQDYQETQQQQQYNNEENNWNEYETEMSQDYQQQQEQQYYDNVANDYHHHHEHEQQHDHVDHQVNHYEDQQQQQQYYEQQSSEHRKEEESKNENVNKDVSNNLVETQTSDVRANDNTETQTEMEKIISNSKAQAANDNKTTRRSSSIESFKKIESKRTKSTAITSRIALSSTSSLRRIELALRRNEVKNAKIEKKEKKEEKKEEENEKEEEAGLAGALSHLRLGEATSPEQDAYEQLMRRQCWESGQVDYTGRDSFDNIWRKISLTLETKPDTELLTSADIEDGKVEYDPKTGASTEYHVIEGGYEVVTTTPQPGGGMKTSKRTFWDPKPVSEEDMKKQQANRKVIEQRMNKEIRIDEKTTMLTRAIEGGYEEVYTTINEDGTKSIKTKTFYDAVPEGTPFPDQAGQPKQPGNKKTTTTDTTDNRKLVQKVNKNQQQQLQNVQQTTNIQQHSTYQETRRASQTIEITENNRTVRKNSLQTEQNIRQVTSSNVTDGKDSKTKKTKKPKGSAPPPPADFVQNDSTTVATKRVPGGIEYTYTTQLESGKTITTSKTVYEEEEVELTEEEIKEYKKTLKDAEKHKNVTTTKKLKSESGTKKVVPSENPGDVTTVETIKIEGGTEYHYTTVTAEGIVKKAVKTVYDPVPCSNPDDTEEEEIVEEYEEEIIEPGEKNIKTIETIKTLPSKFEEEVTITHEKKEKKTKKTMVISH